LEKKLVLGDFLLSITDLREKRKKWGEILENYLLDFAKTAKAKKNWKTQVERQIHTIKTWFSSQKIVYYGDLTREKGLLPP